MIITEKNTTREHISKRHMNTQQSENTSKRHENTPNRETQLKEFCLSFSLVFLNVGISRKEARAHVICTNRRREKEIGHTHDNHRKKHHTWTHIEKTHEHTTKGKHIQKAWKHTKRETQLKEFCLSFSLVFLHVGISRKTKIESTCHLHK